MAESKRDATKHSTGKFLDINCAPRNRQGFQHSCITSVAQESSWQRKHLGKTVRLPPPRVLDVGHMLVSCTNTDNCANFHSSSVNSGSSQSHPWLTRTGTKSWKCTPRLCSCLLEACWNSISFLALRAGKNNVFLVPRNDNFTSAQEIIIWSDPRVKKQDAAHEPECSHVEHYCETSYLNSLHFSPAIIPVHCRLWNAEEGGV